ncbi:unnamed protein product [Arabis nemorensis]|uniref:Uncharacterized protein n=1 Tax=Arabis nemorensis TaxID=586526 RepID=A0A565CDY5_9BRAS|nr:unnamed protein product [Arabis nemorensis]
MIDVKSQQKRWVIGLLQVALSRYSPITYGVKSMRLLTGIGYCQNAFWPFWFIPLFIYGFLPQLAIFYGDFVLEGGSYRGWWNDQRMWLIRGSSSFFFGFIEFTLKPLNLSNHGFNITSQTNDDEEQRKMYEEEIFDFGSSSPMFLPMTMVAIVNLLALVWGLYGLFFSEERLILELMLASFVAVNCFPIYEAMVLRNDNGKLPKKVCFLAGIQTFVLFVSG